MSAKQFVVFDAEGDEIDWIDPYVSHRDISHPDAPTPSVQPFIVYNSYYWYRVAIPEGGWFEIREIDS